MDQLNRIGMIVYADDTFINRNTLRLTLIRELGIEERFVTLCNGQQVIDFVENILQGYEPDENDELCFETPTQPISLIILDTCLPLVDGMETVQRVKE